jgi:hypothetical protein
VAPPRNSPRLPREAVCCRTSPVPWIIERDGSTLNVQIACPVDDWDVLFEEVERRLREDRGILAIELPEKIPGASRIDADVLLVLRRVLAHTSGIPVNTA